MTQAMHRSLFVRFVDSEFRERDLEKAYFRSSVSRENVPQTHSVFRFVEPLPYSSISLCFVVLPEISEHKNQVPFI